MFFSKLINFKNLNRIFFRHALIGTFTCSFITLSKTYQNRFYCDEKQNYIPYIVIGNGTAAHYSAATILNNDESARVLIVSEDKFLPYSFDTRNKNAFFIDHIKDSSINSEEISSKYSFPIFDSVCDFDQLMVEDNNKKIAYIINSTVNLIDTNNQTIVIDSDEIKYNKLILAHDARDINHQLLSLNHQNILKISDIDDYINLINKINESSDISIVGSDAHAYSLAISLKILKPKSIINLICESREILDLLPQFLADKIINHLKKKINVIFNPINNATLGDKITLKIGSEEVLSDLVVVFNRKKVDNRFAAQEYLDLNLDKGRSKCIGPECPKINTLDSRYIAPEGIEHNIFLAGDNVSYEIDSAFQQSGFEYCYTTAKIAGLKACGIDEKFNFLPFKVVSISNKVKFNLVGDCSNDLETISIWKKETFDKINSPGLVMYHKDGIIVGILLWNISNKLDLADEIITKKTKIDDPVDIAKWFIPKSGNKLEEIHKKLLK